MPKNISNLKTKARGNFFADKLTLPYAAQGVVRGQATKESCVPAVCRMLILDFKPHLEAELDFSESYLRHVFNTNMDGSLLSIVPSVLRQAGIDNYEYQPDLTLESLIESLVKGFAIVRVRGKLPRDGHALIIEQITSEQVAIRDPLPDNQGSAYLIELADFLEVWLNKKSGRGIGVIMVK